ncbi:hypothetical protein FLK61_27410 [Paenalkalicoccus suaedae]|uniref:Uncharacterized protein n=1 Tax=Paenalkalicoccus suaedae TaxID=2592382 RepID=A0A859FD36_9BACI|nr:hypothetical protein [Paenalkalicoccus suaedae]QKS70484.1 hypothetical protein FLK61_27410 [Paenalkalicoccus suaedae]
MNAHKVLYSMLHLVMPLILFSSYFLWGQFVLSKPLWENVTDNLSILAIYYIGVSVLWLMNIDNVEKVRDAKSG